MELSILTSHLSSKWIPVKTCLLFSPSHLYCLSTCSCVSLWFWSELALLFNACVTQTWHSYCVSTASKDTSKTSWTPQARVKPPRSPYWPQKHYMTWSHGDHFVNAQRKCRIRRSQSVLHALVRITCFNYWVRNSIRILRVGFCNKMCLTFIPQHYRYVS